MDQPNEATLIHTGNFAHIYDTLLSSLIESPFEERNKRTGVRIKMLPGGCSFKVDMTDQKLPVTGSRKLFPHVAAAEQAWFLLGQQDVTWINEHAPKVWGKFVEADGKTVEAAYGYRWKHAFDRDQIRLAIEALKRDPTDRRIWVQAWDPRVDGLGAPNQKNVPCPVGFSFSIIDGFLHSSIFIRSSDVFVGLPYDVMGHAMLMAVVASSVGAVGLGTMHVTLAHPHLYEMHYDMADACLAQTHFPVGPDLFAWRLEDVEKDPDGFVWAYRKAAKSVAWPSYAPLPELVL